MTQKEALEVLKTGCNVFLTGSAGCGKTHVLNMFITHLKLQQKKVGITASTGVAATHINGMTIHSWAGIGVKKEITDREIEELLKKPYLHRRFRNTHTLIIDEVSMLPSAMLEAVDKVCRAFKQQDLPFGGIQVVLCGDFFQLPPIKKQSSKIDFIFKSSVWNDLDLKVCYLEKPYRQYDLNFLHVLEEIRRNRLTQRTWDTLKQRFIQPLPRGIIPTKLYTHNDRADAINATELAKIPERPRVFVMKSRGNETLTQVMKKSCLAPDQLVLKKGALVMFVKNNFEEGYVNGTLGRVLDFDEKGSPVVQTFEGKQVTALPADWEIEEDGEIQARITQLPLRLAWAITIHKSQGMSLDAAEIDLGKSFVSGMGYVALSRVRTLEGIRLRSINRTALTVNNEIIAFDRKLREMSKEVQKELQSSYWYKKNAEFLERK